MFQENNMKNHAVAVLGNFILLLLLVSCSSDKHLFTKDFETFQIKNSCVQLATQVHENIKFQGTVWYDEDNILHSGTFGLHWMGSQPEDTGVLPIDPIQMFVSSDGAKAIFDGLEADLKRFDPKIFLLENRKYQKAKITRLYNSPVWTDDDLWLGTKWDFESGTITAVTTDLKTGNSQESVIADRSVSSEPAPKIARNGILTYNWYQNYAGPRLVVYDTVANREVARYKDISYQIRPACYGNLLGPEGTHIVSVSSLLGEGYDGKQQELFGVKIGEEPVQITDFHSKYPYALICGINFGGQRWSPDNRWIVINVLPSETGQFDSSVDPNWLFLIDLEENIGYQICQQINPKDQHSVAWSPDSHYLALSINNKIWVIDPEKLESRLLVEKSDVPLKVLGWTIP